ncbi:hypothetical protein [Alienimonas chondri]|uniref:DUF2809 domain-containing protein n=1 Tax=Alienimonas chondri TaxID=2681879 RepID=A0ABX1VK56_9PLAN|nr:hypothetical protein [Alienimonas chondri]NNJ27557.1 hypothetical protein [Alienimonas chondri]
MFEWLAGVDFDQPHNLYNAFEAGLWSAVAVALACRPTPARASGYRWALVAVLLAFAASDIWELKTGAWWRPWPLCVLKFACGGGGSLLALLWWRAEREAPAAIGEEETPAAP